MKEKILGAFLMLLLPAVCSAGEEPAMKPQKQSDANITGHVVDAKTYEHLAFATTYARQGGVRHRFLSFPYLGQNQLTIRGFQRDC